MLLTVFAGLFAAECPLRRPLRFDDRQITPLRQKTINKWNEKLLRDLKPRGLNLRPRGFKATDLGAGMHLFA